MNTLMLLFHFALVTTIYGQSSNTAGTADSVIVNANQTTVPPESYSTRMTSRSTDSIATTESRSNPSASSSVVNDTSTASSHSSNTVTDPGSPNSTANTPTLTVEASSVPEPITSNTIQPNGSEATEPISDTDNSSGTETLTLSPTGSSEHTTATEDSISKSQMWTLRDSSTPSTTPTTVTDLAEPTSTDVSSTELLTSDISTFTRDSPSTPSSEVTKTIPATTLVNYSTTPTYPPGLCLSNPCPSESICVDLYEDFTCQCLSGMFFTGSSCITAKVFPGNLHLTSINFSIPMSDTRSKIFKELAQSISETMAMVFKDNVGYKESKVISLKEGSVVASLENIFAHNSLITEKDILEKIENAIKSNSDYPLLKNATFSGTNACDSDTPYCVSNTTSCKFENGIVSCSCLDEYVPFWLSSRTCIACPVGQKAENGKCVLCPFGYSGFNCNDSALLAVVVISCVLGGLLLFTLLALLIICCRTPSKGHDHGSPYSIPNAAEPWHNQGIPKIPRATNIHWERSEMEMTENGKAQPMAGREQVPSKRGYYDDLKNFAGRNTSKYAHLVQGQENPYFVHED